MYCLLYKELAFLPQENRAVNSDVFHDNWHTIEIIGLLVVETSIKYSILCNNMF